MHKETFGIAYRGAPQAWGGLLHAEAAAQCYVNDDMGGLACSCRRAMLTKQNGRLHILILLFARTTFDHFVKCHIDAEKTTKYRVAETKVE